MTSVLLAYLLSCLLPCWSRCLFCICCLTLSQCTYRQVVVTFERSAGFLLLSALDWVRLMLSACLVWCCSVFAFWLCVRSGVLHPLLFPLALQNVLAVWRFPARGVIRPFPCSVLRVGVSSFWLSRRHVLLLHSRVFVFSLRRFVCCSWVFPVLWSPLPGIPPTSQCRSSPLGAYPFVFFVSSCPWCCFALRFSSTLSTAIPWCLSVTRPGLRLPCFTRSSPPLPASCLRPLLLFLPAAACFC